MIGAGAGPVDPRFDIDEASLRRRRGMKWSRYGPDVLAAWVADMDYAAAPPIAAALTDAIARGELGYPAPDRAGLPDSVSERYTVRHSWSPDPAHALVLPDVMRGVELTLAALTEPGDGVVVTTPVYPPFLELVAAMGRRLVAVPLTDGWQLDPEHLREAVERERPRALLLCNPHNPSGRVLSAAELTAAAEVAIARDLVVIADEIHADLTYPGSRHVPIASLGDEVALRTVTLTSASKSHNLAGMRCALALTGSAAMRAAVWSASPLGHEPVGVLGVVATLAAWTPAGDEWLRACLDVLDRNRRRAVERLTTEVPGLRCDLPEATYLLWLDCGALGLGDDPARHVLRHGRVALSEGPRFGPEGRGFARLNVATSPALLEAVLDRTIAGLLTPPG